MELSGGSWLLRSLLQIWHRRSYIRVINYHGTPEESTGQFERQLQWYRRCFVPVGVDELDAVLHGQPWVHSRPGLILTFDDGLRNNFDFGAPLLDRYGFKAWFMVPVDFVSCASAQQRDAAREHSIQEPSSTEGERIAMSWGEVAQLAERHEIGCHTATHRRLAAGIPPEELNAEIVEARQTMEMHLGKPVNSFCWVGGEESSYSASAAKLIRDSGYKWSFMTNNEPVTWRTDPLQIQRSNVEADWPLSVVKFQVSGLMDKLYWPKRRRVCQLTKC